MSDSERDFFVSYAGADRAWALWISQQLASVGYSVELDVWDWPVGSNFIDNMEIALRRARRMVAVLSEAYFDPSSYAMEERTAALRRAKSESSHLLPVKIASCELPPLIAPLIYVSLVDLDAEQARSALLDAARGPVRPDGVALFPVPPERRSRANGPPPFPAPEPTVALEAIDRRAQEQTADTSSMACRHATGSLLDATKLLRSCGSA